MQEKWSKQCVQIDIAQESALTGYLAHSTQLPSNETHSILNLCHLMTVTDVNKITLLANLFLRKQY